MSYQGDEEGAETKEEYPIVALASSPSGLESCSGTCTLAGPSMLKQKAAPQAEHRGKEQMRTGCTESRARNRSWTYRRR